MDSFVLLQKAGLAVGLFFVGQVLSWAGYVTPRGTTTPITQPDSALTAIRLMIGPVPAVVLAAGILLVYLFPITKAGTKDAGGVGEAQSTGCRIKSLGHL